MFDLIEGTVTHATFAGALLAELSVSERGMILERVVKKHDELTSGYKVADADDGTCVNGACRGADSLEFDYTRIEPDGRVHVEVKSSQLKWNSHASTLQWKVTFSGVKCDLHDELRLAVYTPDALLIFVHGSNAGVSKAGKVTEVKGMDVTFGSTKGECDWRVAVRIIRTKIEQKGCQFVGRISLVAPKGKA